MQAEQKHPADELAKSLSRAGGILTLLANCYEGETEGFALGNGFVHQSIQQVEAILARASEALGRLYESYDLSLVGEGHAAPVPAASEGPNALAEMPVAAPQAVPAITRAAPEPAPQMGSYLSAFGPGEGAPRLADRLDTFLVKPAMAARADVVERPAESYDEFLQKLTAVADRAAFQAHASPADRSLVPALEGLRADLIKLRGAA